jgi:uncharacterized membrane protein YhaH (DUF805 family)
VINKIEKYKKYFAFTGKATRSEYWGTYLISTIFLLCVVIPVSFAILAVSLPLTIIVVGFAGIALSILLLCVGGVLTFWLYAATTIRRCNDAGINPWFALTLLLPPPFGTIPFIVFGVLKTDTTNGSTD